MIAVVFPGQGSQKPGMGRELVERSGAAALVFDRIGDALGIDVRALCWESDEETLRQTQNAQLALYSCGVAAWAALQESAGDSLKVFATAGHSVGEYAALAAAGAYSVEEGAKLVRTRGNLMASAGKTAPGTMAAVLGLDRAELEAACEEAAGLVVVANDNCPGQLVISGEVDAVKLAGEIAQAKGAKRVLPLNVSGAFHSPLMAEPAREMAVALADAKFAEESVLKVYSNVTSEIVSNISDWVKLLEEQLENPVRWTESIQHMLRDGVTTFVECGGGNVLSGLIGRIDKSASTLRVADSATLDETLAAIAAS